MENIAREVLAGIALGGFTATMINANLFALKTLWHVNRLAAETTWEMFHGWHDREWERRRRQRET